MLQKIRFFSSVGVLYIATLGTIGGILYSSHLFGSPVWAKSEPVYEKPVPLPPRVISGKPVKIIIESASIDLLVDAGTYNESDGSWTLSDTRAQYATMTPNANDHSGATFIYGHGTYAVFGRIGTHPPPAGTIAKLVTDNGKVFVYALQEVKDYNPDDVSLFAGMANGSPRLIVQTCTGAFSQWRTMFTFRFERIEQ